MKHRIESYRIWDMNTPFPAMAERDPSVILNLRFPSHEE